MYMKKRAERAVITLLLAGMLFGCTAERETAAEVAESQAESTEERTAESAAEDTAESAAESPAENTAESAAESTEEAAVFPAIDFTLSDQYGNTHTLSAYKGRVVFLNFWATWCPPCRAEMPDIQKLYAEYEAAGDDSVVILGVAAPGYGNETDLDGITAFLTENGYTYPVVMDETGEVFTQYYVYSYPTTYMIDKEGNVFGYLTGSMPEETMRSIIEQTLSGKRENP